MLKLNAKLTPLDLMPVMAAAGHSGNSNSIWPRAGIRSRTYSIPFSWMQRMPPGCRSSMMRMEREIKPWLTNSTQPQPASINRSLKTLLAALISSIRRCSDQITDTLERISHKPKSYPYITFDELPDESWAIAGKLLDEE